MKFQSNTSLFKKEYWNWFLLSLFFAYQYLLRVYPSTFTNEIRESFGLSAQDFATLSTYCMFMYSGLQIPLGFLLDRMGIRRLTLIAFGLCLAGQFLFTYAPGATAARCGRILIGIGAAPAYMSAVKLISDSFSEKLCGLFIGLTCTFSLIFVIIGNGLLKTIGTYVQYWQSTVGVLNVLGIILFVLCALSLPKPTTRQARAKDLEWKQTFLSVVTQYRFLLYALLSVGTYAVVTTLSDLWAHSFLMTKYGLSEMESVYYNQFIFGGLLLGGILLPLLFIGKRTLLGIGVCSLVLILSLGILIDGPATLPRYVLQGILCLMGVFGCADILCFTLALKTATPKTSGLIIGWMNTINILGLALLEGCVARALDHHWSGILGENGLRLYQTQDYEFALRILLYVSVITLLITCVMRMKSFKLKA